MPGGMAAARICRVTASSPRQTCPRPSEHGWQCSSASANGSAYGSTPRRSVGNLRYQNWHRSKAINPTTPARLYVLEGRRARAAVVLVTEMLEDWHLLLASEMLSDSEDARVSWPWPACRVDHVAARPVEERSNKGAHQHRGARNHRVLSNLYAMPGASSFTAAKR